MSEKLIVSLDDALDFAMWEGELRIEFSRCGPHHPSMARIPLDPSWFPGDPNGEWFLTLMSKFGAYRRRCSDLPMGLLSLAFRAKHARETAAAPADGLESSDDGDPRERSG